MVLLTATNCCLSGGGITNAQDNLITKTLANYSQQAVKDNLNLAVWTSNSSNEIEIKEMK